MLLVVSSHSARDSQGKCGREGGGPTKLSQEGVSCLRVTHTTGSDQPPQNKGLSRQFAREDEDTFPLQLHL